MQSNDEPGADFKDLSSKLKKLLDLSANVYANERDNTFRLATVPSREIIYVFDQTVLEMFIALDEGPRKYPAAFHLEEWRDLTETKRLHISDTALEALWISLNRQTATIAGEFLLSGNLPGQVDGQFYMTRGHYEEFGSRVDSRAAEATKLFEIESDGIIRSLENLKEVFYDRSNRELNVDFYLKDDLHALFKDDPVSSVDSANFRRTRAIAGALSNADALNRIKQLNRVTSAEILDRIVPLDLRFPTRGIGRLPDQALYYEWLTTIDTANKQRTKRFGTRFSRSPKAIQNDAAAISYVQWIARTQLSPLQRIVFVTGDSLLAASYAKWHKDRVVKEPGEPRVLRKIQQYAPILNLGDMHLGITRTSTIFDMLRESVETSLLAFNLSGRSNHQESNPEILWSSRSDLALRLEGVYEDDRVLEFFNAQKEKAWFSHALGTFNDVARRFREFERIAIGLSETYIVQRAQSILDHLQSWIDGRDLPDGARLYIEGLLEDIARQNIDLWFRIALDSLQHKPASRVYVDQRLYALRLKLPSPYGSIPLVDVVEELVEGYAVPNTLSSDSFLEERHLVFAVAAVVALSLGKWTQGHRFAELSISAANHLVLNRQAPLKLAGQSPHESGEEDINELRFLCAVSSRMRIEARGPADFFGDDVWALSLDEGLSKLEVSRLFYVRSNDVVGHLRTLSEQSAIRLSYVSWLPILRSKLQNNIFTSNSRGYSVARAVLEFRLVLADLAASVDILMQDTFEAVDPVLEQGSRFQANVNVAVAYALTKISDDFSSADLVEKLGTDRIRKVAEWWLLALESNQRSDISKKLRPSTRRQVQLFLRDQEIDITFEKSEERRPESFSHLDSEMSAVLAPVRTDDR